MPPRWMCCLIVAGWLASTGWLAWREVAPLFARHEPPPFAVELVDEFYAAAPPVNWFIYRVEPTPGKPEPELRVIGRLKTSLRYSDADDTFVLRSEVSGPPPSQPDGKVRGLELPLGVSVRKMINETTITRDGELRAVTADATVAFWVGDVSAHLDAAVRDGKLSGQARIEGDLLSEPVVHTIDPTPVRGGSVLNPLQPVNRVTGLFPGRQWEQQLVSPLDSILAGIAPQLAQAGPPRALHASVQEATERVTVAGREHECLVIVFEGEKLSARTWVRKRDGLVLRQEAASPTEGRLRLQRESLAE